MSSENMIDCLALRCTPKHNYFGKSLIIVNVYIPPATPNRALTLFFDSLIETVGPYFVNILFILYGDLIHINAHPLSVIILTDLVDFPTRQEAQLEHFLVSHASVLTAQRHAPLSISNHDVVLAIPKIYCKSRTRTLIHPTSQSIKLHYLAPENV